MTATRPPALDLPLPTTTLILPPAPRVDDPVRSEISPLVPVDAVPEVKEREPLVPPAPDSAVRTLNAPLEVARPYPLIIESAPPVTCVLSPAFIAIRPPPLRAPLPATTLTLPAFPEVDAPV